MTLAMCVGVFLLSPDFEDNQILGKVDAITVPIMGNENGGYFHLSCIFQSWIHPSKLNPACIVQLYGKNRCICVHLCSLHEQNETCRF